MYFGRADLSFEKVVAFLTGLDMGTSGRLLDGFREYLILRLGEGTNLGWPALVLKAHDLDVSGRPTTPEEDRAGVDAIFDVLDEFLAEFPVERGRARLHHEYFLWKQQLEWFDLDLERFRSSPQPDMMSLDEAADELGVVRTALFDLVAAGQLEIFRSGAELFVRRARVVELRSRHHES
ncbi:hypothetical protein [Plantactinospora sp. WMMB782]|uniref:hypothetical protein n=1 Tax=Plantactinospora sp. WMMB782 TaxID=3404121 RepID=UPI003B936805